jgi:hypothetical protein
MKNYIELLFAMVVAVLLVISLPFLMIKDASAVLDLEALKD